MQNIFDLHRPNVDAIDLVEGILARLRSGESVSVAVVEVRKGREVATAWSQSPDGSYHLLNSGAARLSARLAID